MIKPSTLLFIGLLLSSHAQAKTTLNVLWFTVSPADQALPQKYASMYETGNPDVEIQYTFVPHNQLTQRLQVMIAGKNPPDVARVITANISEFGNVAQDLRGVIQPTEFVPLQQAYMRRDGKVIGAPLDVTVAATYYNKVCFAQAGITVPTGTQQPWTWAQWRTHLDAVRRNTPCRYGVSWDFQIHRWSALLYQAGGSFMNADQSRWTAQSAAGAKAINFFKSLMDDGLLSKSPWLSGEEASTLFKSGLSATYVGTTGAILNLQAVQNLSWGVMPMPRDKIRSTTPGGTFVMGFKNSQNPQEAARFIAWLSSKAVNAQYVRDAQCLSPRIDSQQLDYGDLNSVFQTFNSDLKRSPAFIAQEWAHPSFAKMNTFIREQIVKVLLNQQSSAAALQAIDDQGNKFLQQVTPP